MANWDSIVLLTINLSNGWVNKTIITDKKILKKYLGGRGVATYHFLSEVDPFVDPYSPGNPIIFAPGTLTGTFVPCSGRTSIIFKSPTTNRFFKTNVGGSFGAQLKFAGYDILIVEGRADEPVYIYIENEKIEIRSAKHLWGKDMRETNRIVREENDDDELQLACIGPAGENKVAYASIHASIYNAAGRGGGGAIMGDKNLKAIAVKGTKSIGVSRPEEFTSTVKRLREKMEEASGVQPLSDYGTSVGVESTNTIGAFPVKNFQQSAIDNVHLLTGQYLVESGLLKRKISCYSCPVGCHRFVTIDDGKYRGTYCGGPEYETISAFGGGCLSTDMKAVIKANELCNIFGLDVISTGGCIQWLMECKQRGIISDLDADGLDLSWGNMDTVIKLVKKIAYREGIGDLLAKGLKVAASEVGHDSYKWAVQARGLEQSRVETRSAFAYALAFAISSRGPDHLNTECLAEFGGSPEAIKLIERITGSKEYAHPYTTDKRAEIVRWHEDIYAAGDSLGICAFPTTAQLWMDEFDLAELYSNFSGFNVTADEIMMAGRRVITMERIFNGILGHTRKEDVMPYRMMYEQQQGAMHDNAINSPELLDVMKDQYFKLHGWNMETGLPTGEVLKKLEMDEFASKATFLQV